MAEAKVKTVDCPTDCGALITVVVDPKIGGADTYCPGCGTRVWVPIVNVAPVALPLAAKRADFQLRPHG